MEPMQIGIIGCGVISDIYLTNLVGKYPHLIVKGCADLMMERAEAQATKYGITAMTVDEMMVDTSIALILNLTIPRAHKAIALQALHAGKHVYGEKPLATNLADGLEIVALAKEKGLMVGSAPDTFLGAGLQTVRKLIDDGWIGTPVAATAFMMCHGHESWHPDPAFYYDIGGGPMYDMGPYYLTALVSLLGPVTAVSGSAKTTWKERVITSSPKKGQVMPVVVPTHVSGILNFESGAVASIIMSFDVWSHQLPRIEIYGSEGTISVPDPNTFGGPVLLKRGAEKDWHEIPLSHGNHENSRGLGVADMVHALQTGGKTKADMSLACHVLEIMHGIHESEEKGLRIPLSTHCERPEAMKMIPVAF